ncbi:MAG: ATP synthase F1 subunit epsilon [Planctomycetota bacterium]|nr:ATP synthase F1 subunit epsilon [Planctomycetota bacterium]
MPAAVRTDKRTRGDLRCLVLTPRKNVFDEFIESATLTTLDGELEVFARFEPTISPLAVGVMLVRGNDGSTVSLAIHGGYMDMNGKTLVILADSAEIGDGIDVERARRALARAKALLAGVASDKAAKADLDRARLALLRALTRLRVAGETAD